MITSLKTVLFAVWENTGGLSALSCTVLEMQTAYIPGRLTSLEGCIQ